MSNFSKTSLQRTITAAAAALVMSTTTIAVTAAPVQAAEPCLLVPAQSGQSLVCSLA